MAQGEGSTASVAPEGLDSQTRVQIAYATLNRLKDYGTSVFKERKPWAELLDRSTFARPPNTSENLQYFRINYLIVLLCTLAMCMFLNPSSLLVLLVLMSGWVYLFILRTAPLTIGGRTIGEREKLIGMGAISFVIVFFLTSVGTVVLSSLLLGCCVIALHGSTRVPDDLFIDDSQVHLTARIFGTKPTAPSFWSILKGEQIGQAKISSIV